MSLMFRSIALGLSLTVWLASSAARSQVDFYKDKQLRLVVSTEAGGAYDVYARLFIPVLREHIPGNPTIIVQNMPGASGLKAMNFMGTSAPRDGTMIASTQSSTLTAQFISPRTATFVATEMSWLGSITSEPFVGYVWHTAPIKTLRDALATEIVMGGTSIGAASTDYPIVARELFQFRIKIVNGYKSSNDVKLAMERGELHGAFANGWSSIRNAEPEWIRDRKIRIIVQHGFRKLPGRTRCRANPRTP
jgi:hypothetical protein